MSGEDSGVDAGSNASNESICMSLASSVSDFDDEQQNDDIAVIDVDINHVNRNDSQNTGSQSVDTSAEENVLCGDRCESRMQDSSYMPSSSHSTIPSMASTSSAAMSSMPMPSVCSHCHYESHCSTSSGVDRINAEFGNHFEEHFLDDTKDGNDLIVVPNDYYYSNEEQHEYYPKIKNSRQKSHDLRRKHIFKDIAGERLLRRAANSNDMDCVRRLLDEGIDPQSCDDRLRTSLHFAASKGYTDVARLLLEKGANPNQKDAIGNTALHLAVCTNNIEVITLLLSAGTDINALDNSGRTPLHLAQSKLKMLHSMQRSDVAINSDQLKSEVLQVLQMMSVYWHRSGKSAELELLTAFTNRLHLSQTSEEVGSDVKDLLTSLSHLTL